MPSLYLRTNPATNEAVGRDLDRLEVMGVISKTDTCEGTAAIVTVPKIN